MLHALDADHVVAISTMLTSEKSHTIKKATKLGFFWGIGHTTALLLIGSAVILLKITIPARFGTPFELMIGGIIILLGIKILLRTFKKNPTHTHMHSHGDLSHTHIHLLKEKIKNHHRKPFTAFLIGTMHGMAGSAALMLIVLSTITNPAEGLFYIIIFGIGTIIGMSICSTLLGLFLQTTKFAVIQKPLHTTIGITAIAFGIFFLQNIYAHI